ncbi:MAG TPA: dihydrofolate reductase family protein [Bacteroidota bacterium]|nr:dihydrofolate reductase family protein [Bacteroidota bacterium]
MRRLILKMSISVDGFVGGPAGEIDWIFRSADDAALRWIEKTLQQAGAHVMGSRTFYDMAQYWPTSADRLAPAMNEIPKIVFSSKEAVDPAETALTTRAVRDKTRIDAAKGVLPATDVSPHAGTWRNATVVKGEIGAEIRKLKEQSGNPLLAHGGARFARSLAASGLIDEYRLLVHPVVLGSGLPLFAGLRMPLHMKLEESTVFDSGAVANVYTPVRG